MIFRGGEGREFFNLETKLLHIVTVMAAERPSNLVFDGEFKDGNGTIYRFMHHKGKRRCDVLFKFGPMDGVQRSFIELTQIFKDPKSSTLQEIHYKGCDSRWIWNIEDDEIIFYSGDEWMKILTRKVLSRVKQSELTEKELKTVCR